MVPLSMRCMQFVCCAAHPCDPPVCLLSLWLVREALGNLSSVFGGPGEEQGGHTPNLKPDILQLHFCDAIKGQKEAYFAYCCSCICLFAPRSAQLPCLPGYRSATDLASCISRTSHPFAPNVRGLQISLQGSSSAERPRSQAGAPTAAAQQQQHMDAIISCSAVSDPLSETCAVQGAVESPESQEGTLGML